MKIIRAKEVQEIADKLNKNKMKISKYEKFGLDQIFPAFMLSRTNRCKHPVNVSCSENVFMSFYNTFVTIFSLKLIANNIYYLGKWKQLVKNLTSYKSNRDNVMFTLFLALMNSSYKLILCFLRRYVKNDKIIAPIAGFIAGLFSILDS